MIQADGTKCRYGGCSKSNEENEKISSGLKETNFAPRILVGNSRLFFRYLETFSVDKRKENLTTAGRLIRT